MRGSICSVDHVGLADGRGQLHSDLDSLDGMVPSWPLPAKTLLGRVLFPVGCHFYGMDSMLLGTAACCLGIAVQRIVSTGLCMSACSSAEHL